MKDFTVADFNLKTDGLPEEQKTFMNNIAGMMCDIMNKGLKGTMSPEDVEKKMQALNDKFKSFNGEEFVQLKKDNDELIKTVKSLSETIDKMKSKGLSLDPLNKFDEKLNEMLDSEKFKEFAEGQSRKSGVFDGFKLKDIVSMTDNYTGNLLITQQQNRVLSQVANKRIHLRDVLSVLQGDPEYPQLAFAQVYDFDRNARFVTENGTLPESSIKVKEIQTSVKRLGTHIRLSKRMLKSRVYIRSYILNMLPEAVYMAEDWNILYGDGNGENLDGIVNFNGVEALDKLIGTSVVSGEAGSVHAVSGANDNADTIIEFTNPQPLILDGMTITFTKASGIAALNSPHALVKMDDRRILLRGVAYSSESATSSLTFTVNYAGYKSIETPNSEDVVKTAFALMTYAQYTPNAICLNPMTVNAMETEKDTSGRPLGIITVQNGVKYIAGRPIIELTQVAPGNYVLGDFVRGANLVDYTNLNLEWAEDVDSKLKNEVVLIAQEEVIFPIYMPWAFAAGSIDALKTAITKA